MTVGDGTRHRRRRYRVLALATAVPVAALLAAAVLVGTGALGGGGTGDRGRLAERLAERAVEILEQPGRAGGTAEPGAAGDRQGHPLAEDGPGRIVCVARTFGFDPPDATAVDQVRSVYVHHMCAEVGPELRWPGAVRAAGPLAVDLTGPGTALRPEQALPGVPEASYADRVRAVIPERYHELAEPSGPAASAELAGLAEELRDRFEAVRDRA